MPTLTDDLARRFNHHPPGPGTIPHHEDMRTWLRSAAEIVSSVPGESREKSLALTHLEESLMWANAHVARNLDPGSGLPRTG